MKVKAKIIDTDKFTERPDRFIEGYLVVGENVSWIFTGEVDFSGLYPSWEKAMIDPSTIKPVEPFTESVPSAEQYIRKQFNSSRFRLSAPEWIIIIGWLESFASLCVEQKTKQIKKDVMITISETLNDSHIFESEYQNLIKKLLATLNHG